jgi:hypothetical protein
MSRRQQLELQATALLIGYGILFAIVCGAIIISGWFAGVMEDHAERVFWSGTVLAGLTVAVFAAAALPGGSNDAREVRRISWLVRLGLVMMVTAPALVIGSLIADFYG